MKAIRFLLLLIIAVASFTSCEKRYECNCVDVTTGALMDSYDIEADNRSEAASKCAYLATSLQKCSLR